MIDINKLHLYTEGWFHSVLAGNHHDENDFIKEQLAKYYDHFTFIPLTNEWDYAYLFICNRYRSLNISGTKAGKVWLSNFNVWQIAGIHPGFLQGFRSLIENHLSIFVKGYKGPFKVWGHSRGGAISQIGGLFLRQQEKMSDVEAISFCSPHVFTKEGCSIARKNKLRHTRLWVDRGDLVDDIGVVFGGKHYGYSRELPDNEHKIIMEHSYKHVNKKMINLMKEFKRPMDVDFLEELAEIETI